MMEKPVWAYSLCSYLNIKATLRPMEFPVHPQPDLAILISILCDKCIGAIKFVRSKSWVILLHSELEWIQTNFRKNLSPLWIDTVGPPKSNRINHVFSSLHDLYLLLAIVKWLLVSAVLA